MITVHEIMARFGREGRRSGHWTHYLCPFHPENNPSFAVHEDSPEWGHCFSCGRNAHAVSVYAELTGLSYGEALRELGLASDEVEASAKSHRTKTNIRLRHFLRKASEAFFDRDFENPQVPGFLEQKTPYLLSATVLRQTAYPMVILPGESERLLSLLREFFPALDLPEKKLRLLEGRLVFPLIEIVDGCFLLWGFVGRAIPGLVSEKTLSEKKYVSVSLYGKRSVSRPLFLAHLPPKDRRIFLVEGVTDALCARSKGLPACAAAGSLGANVIAPLRRYLDNHAPVEVVYLVPDADRGGESALIQAAGKLFDLEGLDLRVLELPPGKDLDEFLMAGGNVEDLSVCSLLDYLSKKALLSSPPPAGEIPSGASPAPSLGEVRLSEKSAEAVLKHAPLEDLLSFLEKLPDEKREKALRQAAEARGLSSRELQEKLTETALFRRIFSPESAPEVFLNPVLDYDHERKIASLGFSTKVSFLGEVREQNFFVFSVATPSFGCFFTPRPEMDLSENFRVVFEKPRYQLPDIDEVWSSEALGRFLHRVSAGDKEVWREHTPALVFQRIKETIRKYLYLEREIFYDVLAAYVILTYFHQVFWSLPFLFFYGNKGAGKSRAMRLFHHLCFNAVLLERGTSAAFCDLFDRRGTGLIDQAESLAYTKNLDVVSMLASSYTKETGKRYVVEIVKGQRRQRRFDLYGPKVIASFREPLFDLKDRLVVIPFLKAPDGVNFPDPTSEAEDWRSLRGSLYALYLLRAAEVADLYRLELARGAFTGRSAEIFVPLATIFRFVGLGEERIQEIFEFFEEMIREISPLVYDRDVQVLEALLEVVGRSFAEGDEPVEVLTGDVVSLLKETGWEEARSSLRAYVEEIIRRNRALLRTVGPGRFYTTRNLVERALARLRENGTNIPRSDFHASRVLEEAKPESLPFC